MTMEKYSQTDNDIALELRNEEAQLMQKMAGFMAGQEKTAAEQTERQQTERRLSQVRARITQIDLQRQVGE